MAQTGVLLQIGCGDGVVVVTKERVYLRGPSQASKDLWSVPRARVAGVQAHAGLILTDLKVRTCDGEVYNAPKVGASDALLAINLLGYVPDRNGNGSDASAEAQSFEVICGNAHLSVSDTEVEWTGERPWRLLRKEVSGVSARMQSPFTELTAHTYSGRICRATQVPVYGAVRVVELLGYTDAHAGNGVGANHHALVEAPRVRRTAAPARRGKVKNTRDIRRAVRSGPPSPSGWGAATSPANGAFTMRASVAAPRTPRRFWFGALLARLHLRRA